MSTVLGKSVQPAFVRVTLGQTVWGMLASLFTAFNGESSCSIQLMNLAWCCPHTWKSLYAFTVADFFRNKQLIILICETLQESLQNLYLYNFSGLKVAIVYLKCLTCSWNQGLQTEKANGMQMWARYIMPGFSTGPVDCQGLRPSSRVYRIYLTL